MCAKIARNAVIVVCLVVVGTIVCFAQATFTAGSSPSVAADIGLSELTGPVSMSVVSGTTVAGPLLITYSAPITNIVVSEISINGTGGLAGATFDVDLTNNSILVHIPAEATVGNQIVVSGVRVAIAGHTLSQVIATLSVPVLAGNYIVVGQTDLIVIGRIEQPFSSDQSIAPPLSYSNGVATQSLTSFKITEKYASAFETSAISVGRIRILPFPSIPKGFKITFPAAAVSSETGAMFQTLSGNSETVPREDGSSDVLYRFVEGTGSSFLIETFMLDVEMTGAAPGTGIIHFQAELWPVGLEIPNAEFPSTDIPRYAERMVPDEIELATGSTELSFPFRHRRDDTYTGIALTNANSYRVRATLAAYDAGGVLITGSNINNPVEIDLPQRGQYAKLASEIFGDEFNNRSAGVIRVRCHCSALQGFYLTGDNSGPKLDGSIGNIASANSWYLPVVFRQGVAPFNLLELDNPGSSNATASLQLFDIQGNLLATQSRTVAAGGSSSDDVRWLFNTDLNSFQGGYIRGISDSPLIVSESFGNALESNVLPVQAPSSLTSFSIPHFASGGQYTTELTLVNTDATFTADVTLTPRDDTGAQIANPVNLQLKTGAQLISTVAGLFPNLGSNLVTGSIKVEQKVIYRGPIPFVPALSGSIRFANIDGSASATLPIALTPGNDFVYSHIAQDANWFTGMTVLNPNTAEAKITIDVYKRDGVKTGTYSSRLLPGERFSKLLYQLVPESEGQSGGYVRVSSDEWLTSFALFGTNDLRSLSAIPPQSVK
jgi:hypothetical protein